MKEITFKVKDNNLHIIVNSSLTNKEFLTLFKERLENLVVLKDSISQNVILNIGQRSLDNREILQLFDILNEMNVFYITKVVCKNKTKDGLMIYKGNFRGGQTRFFHKSVLLIGCINKGSKIIVNGNLYVLGRINGDVEIKDKRGRIYCESINNSLVKIGDNYKLYSEVHTSKEIYCDNTGIVEKDYKKGEIDNVKSNSSYIG